MDLRDLVQRAINSEEGKNELYEMTYGRSYGIALNILKNEEDARDAVQESYIAVFEKLEQLEDAEKLESWISVIVTNKCRDMRRKRKSNVDYDIFEEESKEFIPEDEVDYSELKNYVNEILDGLPKEQRTCILLYYYHEMTICEIAHLLGCSENTIKSRLKYGRDKVRKEVEVLESRGIQLRSIGFVPFLVWMLGEDGIAKGMMPQGGILNEETVSAKGMNKLLSKALRIGGAVLLTGALVTGGFFLKNQLSSNNSGTGAATADNEPADGNESELDKFLSSLPYEYHGGKEWINNLIKSGDDVPAWWWAEDFLIPAGYISAVEEDFDSDGENEIFLVLLLGHYAKAEQGAFPENGIQLQMYEKSSKGWEMSDSIDTGFPIGVQSCMDIFIKESQTNMQIFINSSFIPIEGVYDSVIEYAYKNDTLTEQNYLDWRGSGLSPYYIEQRNIEMNKYGFISDIFSLDNMLMDQNADTDKVVRIKADTFEYFTWRSLEQIDANCTELPSISIQILDYALNDGNLDRNFETYFKKNPIDLSYSIVGGLGEYTGRSLTSDYIKTWEEESLHAYRTLILLSEGKEKEAIEKEFNEYQRNIEDFVADASNKAVRDFGDTEGGTIVIDIGLEGAYDALREKTKEVYRRVFEKDQDFTYKYVFDETVIINQASLYFNYDTNTNMSSEGYIFPTSNFQYLEKHELVSISTETLRLARNEIYARHGRKFEDSELQAYFNSKSWYEGTVESDQFDETILNAYENANLALIREMEEQSN